MTFRLPELVTERLVIREIRLEDREAIAQILDDKADDAWLRWNILNYEVHEQLYQVAYGERLITLKDSQIAIGLIGYAPSYGPFGMLPYFAKQDGHEDHYNRPELGLYYHIKQKQRGCGYATEATQAMIDYAFTEMNLSRIVATTTGDNLASQAVMSRLGMHIERNPYDEPEWFQVVGILENPDKGTPN